MQIDADKSQLWQSQPLRKESGTAAVGETVTLDVSRVRVLTFRVDCPGVSENAHAVFIDPEVL
jgi:hypothetical protein